MTTGTRVLRIGIAPREAMRARTIAIARGTLKRREDDPKIWFTSLESLAQVLSSRNRLLIELIKRSKPASMKELADLSGRKPSNLSRTLHTMEQYGLVKLVKTDRGAIVPTVPYDDLELRLSFSGTGDDTPPFVNAAELQDARQT